MKSIQALSVLAFTATSFTTTTASTIKRDHTVTVSDFYTQITKCTDRLNKAWEVDIDFGSLPDGTFDDDTTQNVGGIFIQYGALLTTAEQLLQEIAQMTGAPSS